jgi:hypothetical protein
MSKQYLIVKIGQARVLATSLGRGNNYGYYS